MRIVLVNSLYAPYTVGGAELVVEYLARCLVQGGHQVTVVSTCSKAEFYSRSIQDGVEVIRFFPRNLWWLYDRLSPTDNHSAPAVMLWRLQDAWNRDAARKFGEILDEISPDIVHTHYLKGLSLIVWREAKRLGIPVVHTAHSYELICTTASLRSRQGNVCKERCWQCVVYGSWHARQTRMIDVFCSPSRFLLQAHQKAGILAKDFAVVRNGALPTPVRPHVAPSPTQQVRFLYLGQLAPHKGVTVLLDALTLLPDVPFVLDIAGKGPLQKDVEDAARLDPRIRFHGFITGADKDNLLSSSDVLIFPSLWVENAPMSIGEAFANRLAVIATDLGASPEFVTNGADGLLMPPGNARALADHIRTLVASPDLLARLRQGATETARDLPSVDAMTAGYLAIYQKLIARPQQEEELELQSSHR